MKTINIALNTRSAFIRDALVYMVNELTRDRPGVQVSFSSRSDTLAQRYPRARGHHFRRPSAGRNSPVQHADKKSQARQLGHYPA